MVPYHKDPSHAAPLHQAARCQHTRLNGIRCGSPALRGEIHCYFHNRTQPQTLYNEIKEPFLPFVEDATSLQFALMRVMRLLMMEQIEYKRCGLLLYSLQIAALNLKRFRAEQLKPADEADAQPQPKQENSLPPQPKPARREAKKKAASNTAPEEPSLPEMLLQGLVFGEGKPGEPLPRIRNQAEYEAALAQRRPPAAALPAKARG